MITGNRNRREKFEHDTFPHLDTLWSTAQWLTMRHSLAENLVLKTMTGAYLEWKDSNEIIISKAQLFRILTREFFWSRNQKYKQKKYMPVQSENIKKGNNSERGIQISAFDHTQLPLLTGVSDVAVKGAIARLNPLSRLMLLLLYRERFSYTNIAYITDLSKSTVQTILSRLHKIIPICILETADYLKEAINYQPTFGKCYDELDHNLENISIILPSVYNQKKSTSAASENWENEGGAVVRIK